MNNATTASVKPAAQPNDDEIMPAVVEQDFAGQAQFARPVLVNGLVRVLAIQTWFLVACTVVVVGVVAHEQMAGNRVWASTPEGNTYELLIHEDEQAAAAYERQHQSTATSAVQQAQ